MNKIQRLIVLVLIFSIALACNLPSGSPTESPVPGAGDGSALPAVTDTATPTATVTGVPPTACTPQIVTTTDSNVRGGPGQVYGILGQLTLGSMATVDGKNSDGTWWYIQFPAGPNGHGWIAGSITTATCIPDTLAIIAAPPTPIPPSFTSTLPPTATLVPSATPTTGLIIVFPPIFPIYSATPTLGFVIPAFTFVFPNP